MDIIGNLQSDHEAWPLSRQAGSELLAQIDAAIADRRARPPPSPPKAPPPPSTLLDAFIAVESRFVPNDFPTPEAYDRAVAVILMELVADTMAAIPGMFGHVLDFMLAHRIDPASVLSAMGDRPRVAGPADPSPVERLILEAERLNPTLPVLQRRCASDVTLGSPTFEGTSVNDIGKGEWVAAMVQAANMDPSAFHDPMRFSLWPYLPGPERDAAKYLTFGAPSGNHPCWGRRPLAMPALIHCMEAAARLQNLRQVAGPTGGPQLLLGSTVGLPARFTRVAAAGKAHARRNSL